MAVKGQPRAYTHMLLISTLGIGLVLVVGASLWSLR